MNTKLLLIVALCCTKILAYSQANCNSPVQISMCPDTTLLGQTNYLMGDDAPPLINLPGEDVLYQINVPSATVKIFVTFSHLTGASMRVTLLRDSCTSIVSNAVFVHQGNTNLAFNVSGTSRYFLWLDAAATVSFDLSFGADTASTYVSHPNTKGDLSFDTSGCATPFFISTKPYYQVKYNNISQTDPMMLSPLNNAGTMCLSVFFQNTTGDEGIRVFSFAFDPGYSNIVAPDTIPGFFNSGNWVQSGGGNNIVYKFYDALSSGRGDFTGSPNSCLRYEFCFNLVPTSNNPSNTNILINITADGFGAGFSGYSASGCCPSGFPSCHYTNGGGGGSGVSSFGFAVNDPGTGTTLPVELVNFDAEPNGQSVVIRWTTAAEINSDYFSIERSKDGNEWQLLQTTKGSGNSTTYSHYESTDFHPLHGTSYYRLKQTDYDGREEYFERKMVKVDFGKEFYVFPNPAKEFVVIESAEGIDFQTNLFTILGEKVRVPLTSMGRTKSIDLSSLPNGIYFLHIERESSLMKREILEIIH